MIELRFGTTFDDNCDLLIIPCHTGGGLSSWVSDILKSNGIKSPDKYIPFGKVDYMSTTWKQDLAKFIGFAASIELNGNYSNLEAIERIGNDIILFCQNKNIRNVNIPLLGTGAGGISPFQVMDLYIKLFNDLQLHLIVYTTSNETHKSLLSRYHSSFKNFRIVKNKTPRVFISYASDDKKNVTWVKELAIRLKKTGINIRLDQFHLLPGTDLPQWMTNEIINADKVILICDEYYCKKVEKSKGGAGWESMIIQGQMLNLDCNKIKFIAIVRGQEFNKALPVFMKSKMALDWREKEELTQEDLEYLMNALLDRTIEDELN